MRSALLLALTLCTAAHAEQAAELWKAKCKSCHGEDGRAQTRMGLKENIPDVSQAAWQQAHTDAQMRQVIAEGSPRNARMKAYKDRLTPEQIDALVAYIRTLKAH